MLANLIHRKTLISMLFLGLSLLGIVSYNKLPMELLPSTELPFLVVQVQSFRNINPEMMEKEAIIPLEGALGSLQGIDKIESYADRRRGGITVYYKNDINMKYAYLRLQEKIDQVKPTLSTDYFVSVFKIDTEMLSNMFMNLQIRGGGGADRLRNLAEKEIIDPLSAVDGVVNVELFGGREKTVEIILDNNAAKAYGITPGRLQSILASNREFKKYAGFIDQSGRRFPVNVMAEYTDVKELENLVINPDIPLLLKDIAEVRFGVKEETSLSRVNGKEAVTAQIVRDNQSNLISVSEEVLGAIEKLNKKLAPRDIKIVVQYDASEVLRTNMDLIKNLALTGALLAILILWYFLRYLRLVSVIALAIPISVLTSLFFFYIFGVTINSLTLVGIALAIGMLLDNSVVVLENIYRLAQHKRDPDTATIQGTKEVWRSIVAATLTTITVFLPFLFTDNFMVRILGYQIGASIISTLLVSLAVALLLIPMITRYFLSRKDVQNSYSGFSSNRKFRKFYFVFLKLTMRNPFSTIIITALIFFISLLSVLALSVNVSRETELKEFKLYVTMSSGSTLDVSDQTTTKLEEMLEKVPEVKDVVAQIYAEESVLSLKLKDDFEQIAGNTIAQVKGNISRQTEDFKAAEVSFEEPQTSNRFGGGGGGSRGNRGDGVGGGLANLMGIGSSTESIVIKGQDMAIMKALAEDIEYQVDALSAVEWSNISIAEERPEIHLFPDRATMSDLGISMNQVAGELSSFENEVSSGLKFKSGEDTYDIIIHNEEFTEKDMDDLKKLPVSNSGGTDFQLEDFSNIFYAFGSARVSRVNRERQVEIHYRFQSEITESNAFLEESRAAVDDLVAAFHLPPGVAVEVIHDENDLSDFYMLISAALILIYMILASVFESLLTPLVIMLTIPLAGIGSLWLILFTGNSLLNANTLVGFLILLGIVVNNGIILLDYTRILRQQGYRRSRALMVAGSARIRPIFITAISTIIAMIPLAMGRAEYVTQIAAPFAITVIGGLSFSTIFTLVFLPTAYTAMETALEWLQGLTWYTKIIQALIFIPGILLIYFNVDSLIWSIIDFLILLTAIPAVTWFVINSLKRARADLIPADQPIVIKIKNLYKVYDLAGKFARDWQIFKKEKTPQKKSRVEEWQDFAFNSLINGYLIYFIYFYLDSLFWVFVLMHPLFFLLFYWIDRLEFLGASVSGIGPLIKKIQHLDSVILWGFPSFNILLFWYHWESPTTAIIATIIWYLSVGLYASARRLREKNIEIVRISGKLAWLRKGFYRLAESISKSISRNPFYAVSGVTLTMKRGMFGLLGPNGAGKTTLMRVICGALDENYGTVHINGFSTRVYREELQGIIGYLPQEFGTYQNMTAGEFLDYQSILKGITNLKLRTERVDYVLEAVHLSNNREEKISSFSGGMKQRIGIAQSLLHLPRILVVDEPTAGLDPRERIRFRNLLVELSRDRVVLFSTHIIEDIASSCDRVAVLNRGKIRYLGNPLEMADLAQGKVWQADIKPEEFDKAQKDLRIIHDIRFENQLRIRVLAPQKPLPNAIEVKPNLEDAYLWLAGSSNGKTTGEVK